MIGATKSKALVSLRKVCDKEPKKLKKEVYGLKTANKHHPSRLLSN